MFKVNNNLRLRLSFYVLICITMAFCTSSFTYKQVKIPLSNDNGVPFYKDEIAYYVSGFEIDEDSNFYFLGGENAVLACFKGAKPIFRKEYTEFMPNQIYAINDKLYVFDYKYRKNNLFILDKTDGAIIGKYPNIITNSVNSYIFRDTSLIMEVFDKQKKIDMSTQLGFVQFTLSGTFVKQAGNPYNIPENLNPKGAIQFLGEWNNSFVYWDYDVDKRLYKFLLRNNEGILTATTDIEEKLFGESFYGFQIEHKKLRNGKIYILGHDGKDAIITELPLKELFNQ